MGRVDAAVMRRIAVFCGSSPGKDPAYLAAAEALGRCLVERHIGLVYGGDRIGLMGAIARVVLEAGGEAIGVIPRFMGDVAQSGLTELRVVETLHERKQTMADLAEGFVALPGGFGTLDEWFEVLTWAQLGQHSKPCGMLQVNGYYDQLLAMLKHAEDEGFIRPEYRRLILVESDPGRLLELMLRYRAPGLTRRSGAQT
jgi:uncharacterized protein (TIGR00730 family)